MLRLLLCTSLIAPVMFMTIKSSDASTLFSFDHWEEDVEPAIKQLESCEPTEMSIFFHDLLITAHSAEYVIDGISTAQSCPDVTFEIVRLIPEVAEPEDLSISLKHAEELQDYINIVGYEAAITETRIKRPNDVRYGDRSAILKISVGDSPRA